MPAANCPECNGTGWKIIELNPRTREELSGAAKCSCVDPDRVLRAVEGACIPPLYTNASFDNFRLGENQQLRKVFMDVRSYANKYPATKEPGLLLVGEPGTGKTHLAVAAFRTILSNGHKGLFFDYQNLLDRIKSGYDQVSNMSDKEAYRDALETDILLLDDLGANRISDWVEDIMTSIITYRGNNRKVLIATTNLIDGDLGYTTYERPGQGPVNYKTTLTERIGSRARSRLFEMCRIIKMPYIDDHRVQEQKKKGVF